MPEAEEASENHLGINTAENNLIFFTITIYKNTNSKLLLYNERRYNQQHPDPGTSGNESVQQAAASKIQCISPLRKDYI